MTPTPMVRPTARPEIVPEETPMLPSHFDDDTWLVELPGLRWDEADARRARHRTPDLGLDVLTAVDEDETWIYATAPPPTWKEIGGAAGLLTRRLDIDRDALPGFRHRRLQVLLTVGDLDDGARQSWHYTSQTDIPAAVEDEFNRWFDEEHLPQLAAVEGTVSAARYRTDGAPRYLAAYDLTEREVQGGPAWRAAITTPWRDRIHHEFVAPRRLMLSRLP